MVVDLIRVDLLDDLPDGDVQIRPAPREEGLVRDVLDDGVLEGQLGLRERAGLVHQLQLLQCREVNAHLDERIRDRGEQGRAEAAPDRGRVLQSRLDLLGQPVDPRAHDVLDRGREVDGHVPDPPDTILAPDHDAPLQQRRRDLLDGKRVAFGLLEDAAEQVPGHLRSAEHALDQRLDLLVAEQLEDQRRVPRLVGPAYGVFGTLRRDQERRALADSSREEPQVVFRRAICPVQVFQRQHERPGARRRHGQGADRLEGPAALGLWIQVPDGVVLAGQLEQLAEKGQELVDILVEGLHAAAKLFFHLERRVAVFDLKAGAKDLEQRQVRRALPVGRALPFEPCDRLVLERLPELEQQSRLAHPRLAHQADDLASARLRSLPASGEAPQFLPDVRPAATVRARCGPPGGSAARAGP